MNSSTDIRAELQKIIAHASGTDSLYRHTNLLITDGMRAVADRGGMWWLVDAIASHQRTAAKLCGSFQVWNLEVWPNKEARLTCTDGRDDTWYQVIQVIDWTDCPLESLRVYVSSGVLMLPGEY
jgi:hypothetical protein